jgi:hypothetical protein
MLWLLISLFQLNNIVRVEISGMTLAPCTLGKRKGEETMRDRKTKTTATLGELIFAVTNEVDPLVPDRIRKYAMVSSIVSDLLARGRIRFVRRSPFQVAGNF